MAFTWVLSEIRDEFRDRIRRHSTAEISDANCNNWINEYYRNILPEELRIDRFQTDFTQDITPTDSGEYSLGQGIVAVEEPVTIDGSPITLTMEKKVFFGRFPEKERWISPPTLVIGTSSTSAVRNSAFRFRIADHAYAKAAGETELSGDAVPANLYGAWMLTIDSDSDITITEADDNATGYATPGLAVAALAEESTDDAVMGFVTVVHTSIFTPGTTSLSASGITTTFTDGSPSYRATPEMALIAGGKLYVRPKSDDWHRLESQLTLQRPSELSGDAVAPLDIKWGPLIAVGAAMLFISKKESDLETLAELGVVKKAMLNNIGHQQILQWTRNQRSACPAY